MSQINGYCFEFQGKRRWRASSDDLWEIVMRTLPQLRRIGQRRIDGSLCTVYRAPDGKFYAVTAVGAHQ